MIEYWDIYDEKYQADLNNCKTVGDAQILIDENSIYTMQIHVIDNINPKVE